MNTVYTFQIVNKVKGKIYDYFIANPGDGYNVAPTAVVTGNGTGASLSVNVSDNVITSVNVLSEGSGYTYANVVITPANGSPGNNAQILPFLTKNVQHEASCIPKNDSESSAYALVKNIIEEFFDNNKHTLNVVKTNRN